MKIKLSNKCEYCGNIDYLEHFFWSCIMLKSFWHNVCQTISAVVGKQIHLKENDVIFGYDIKKQNSQENKNINYIILIAKMSISKYKYGDKYDLSFVFEHELALRKKYMY